MKLRNKRNELKWLKNVRERHIKDIRYVIIYAIKQENVEIRVKITKAIIVTRIDLIIEETKKEENPKLNIEIKTLKTEDNNLSKKITIINKTYEAIT